MDLNDDSPPDLVNTDVQSDNDHLKAQPEYLISQLSNTHISKVPLTIITGYLGSGKTTLVNYILRAHHRKKIAVILNEFGDTADIERTLTVSHTDRTLTTDYLTLGNGCICCSVKDAGVNAIEGLMARHAAAAEKGEGEGKPFDYIILETSGLADPGNLVPLFWVDEGLGSSLFLDGVVCLVDAGNLVRSLEEPSEDERAEVGGNREETVAHRQISGADVLVLNKCDRIPTAEELERVEERARSVNGLAKVVRTEYGRVPQLEGWLLDLRAYDGIEAVDTLERGKRRRGGHVDPTISTISLPLPILTLDQFNILESWLRSLLWDARLPGPQLDPTFDSNHPGSTSFSIYRTKGRIIFTDGSVKMIQGVREVFEIVDADYDGAGAGSASLGGKIVFIGRGLDGEGFERSLEISLKQRA